MSSLEGRQPKDTFKSLIKLDNGGVGLDSTLRAIEDGNGTNSGFLWSTSGIRIQNGFTFDAVSGAVMDLANFTVNNLNAAIGGTTPSTGEFTTVVAATNITTTDGLLTVNRASSNQLASFVHTGTGDVIERYANDDGFMRVGYNPTGSDAGQIVPLGTVSLEGFENADFNGTLDVSGATSLNLPTSAGASGTLWNDSGTVKVSP